MKKLSYVLFFILFSNNLSAQTETEPLNVRKFGFGLKANVINLIDLVDENLSPAKILLTISPSKSFRIEPEFGILSVSNDDFKSSGISVGIGLYPMVQKGRTNIYGGFNVNNLSVNQDQNSALNSPRVERKYSRLALGLKMGGEYFVGNHFSIGGDVGIASVKSSISIKSNGNGTADEPEQKSLLTESSIVLRIYL